MKTDARYGFQTFSVSTVMVRYIVPPIGAAIACCIFGLIQFLGWSAEISRHDKQFSLKVLGAAMGLAGFLFMGASLIISPYVWASVHWRPFYALTIVGVVFGPAALVATGTLGYLLWRSEARSLLLGEN
jgi:hypothetical protein